MTKTELSLGLVGAITSAFVLYEVVTVSSPTRSRDQGSGVVATAPAHTDLATTPNASRQNSSGEATAANESTADLVKAIIPPSGQPVPDQSLLRLSSIVNIANSVNAVPDKARWEQALPIARTLSSGSCDCAQRIWLTHFIEMGEYAMNGDNQNYFAVAQGLVALGRNDKQAQEQNHEQFEQGLR